MSCYWGLWDLILSPEIPGLSSLAISRITISGMKNRPSHRRVKRTKIIINVKKRVYYEKNNKRYQTLTINVDIFSNGLWTLYSIFLQFVQIRNSSSFVQQSAKFIFKQLLQNKRQRKRNRQGFFSTFHVTFVKIINVYALIKNYW